MADEVKFTPGPWRLDERYTGAVLDSDRTQVAMATMNGFLPVDVRDANARLIAAAPDLLAALQRLIHPDGGEEDDIRAARAAITKATQA